MEEESNKKRMWKASLVFDWDKLLDSHDDSDPPERVVTKISSDMSQSAMRNGFSNRYNYESLSDVALDELIARRKGIYQSVAPKLPDKGKLLSDAIAMLEQEKERRYKSTPKLKDDNGSEMPTHFESSSVMKSNKKRMWKASLVFDWDKLLDSHDDSDLPERVVTKISSDMTQSAMGNGDSNQHNYESLSDVELDELIARRKGIYQSVAPKLPDKGKLLSDVITMLEQEKERRYKNTPKLKNDNGSEMPTHFESSSVMIMNKEYYRTLNGKNEEVNNKLRQANEALPTLQEALNKEKQRANQLTSEVESWKKKFEEAEQSRQSERIRAEGAEKKLNEAPKNEQIIEEFKKSEEFKDAVVVECAGVFKTIVERRWLFYKDDLNRPFSEWVDFEAKLKADADGSGLRK